MPHLRRFAFFSTLLGLLVLSGSAAPFTSASHPARLTLWAWERPEDLRFVTSGDVQVAVLVGSVYLEQQPIARPRQQPLRVGEHTPIIAVVRLEITRTAPAHFPDDYPARVAEQVMRLAAVPRVSALQIDFDATRSQRDFYRALLADLRQKLPRAVPLSITALGSWCQGDDWLGALPIDDAVPMMFRMGPDRYSIVQMIDGGGDFREPLCRQSVGVSTDEPWPAPLLGRNVYVFSPHAWTPTTVEAVERKILP